ncbi:hypothetical protein B5P43_31840 [Bacillus sp. SRB_336]|nr:hypothetical protein B5P43_31840 [Bacillus sp. SRB_336]
MDNSPAAPDNEPSLNGFMLYTPEQVAAITGLSVHTLRRLAKQGKIPHKRVSRNAIRFNAEDIKAMHAYFTAQALAATPPARDDSEDSPFNFTSRGKAIARNRDRGI